MHFDPYMPLIGNYFFQTGETRWNPATSRQLSERLASSNPPEFRTVLGIIAEIYGECPLEGWPYLGPMYIDFDSEDITESISDFHEVLEKLEAMDLDLNQIRLYASGGRGFHVEVPMACFIADVSTDGVMGLPYIYKEIALALYVDTLDLRVYSARKGRQWRVPNRQRSNGHYKVPLSVSEAVTMTPARYAELTSAPRPFPPLALPELCPALATMYGESCSKFEATNRRKAVTSSREVAEVKQRFQGKLPPSLEALGQGCFPARGGFNQIAFQMCLAAQTVGMDEAATLKACAGLIQNHESDGHRYNTPSKRRDELRTMYRFVDRSTYSFSVGGALSILPISLKCNDFRGMAS
jgi:hypothetical protein